MKDKIRSYVSKLEADTVGFAAATDYSSKQSSELKSILPTVRSLVVTIAFAA